MCTQILNPKICLSSQGFVIVNEIKTVNTWHINNGITAIKVQKTLNSYNEKKEIKQINI